MTRTFATLADPHRDLLRLTDDAQRGADIRALEGSARLRLEARDLRWKPIGRDGVLVPDEFDRIVVAARYLGATDETLAKKDAHNRRVLTVGAQRLIRHPADRTHDQLERAAQRWEALLKQREAREKAKRAAPSSVLHPTPAQRVEARRVAHEAFQLAFEHKALVHYTEGVERWQGLAHKLRAAKGQFPTEADCSAMFSWAWWNGLTHVFGLDVPDVLNGSAWLGGYTGTLLSHGWAVSLSSLELGDPIIYGARFPGAHVAFYVGDGMVLSHGSEAGPFLLPVHYRGDFMAARRYL